MLVKNWTTNSYFNIRNYKQNYNIEYSNKLINNKRYSKANTKINFALLIFYMMNFNFLKL